MTKSTTFWSGRKVLVTGAGGFIGSHLAERLVSEGANVRAMVHYNALGKCGWLDESAQNNDMEIIAGDICDRDSVRQAMAHCDTVFHLAALIAIPYSYQAPASYVRTNVEGTMNVMQSAREEEVRRVLHTSTSEVYGTARYVPIDEEHPLQGQSPYSASKIGADMIAESFFNSFNVPLVTIRPFNTFGPRQSMRAIIPTIISQCLAGKEQIKLGSLSPTRDMNFVSNTVDGYLMAAQAMGVEGEAINLGSGREISVGDLANLIADLVGSSINIVSDEQRVRPAKSEVERLLACHQKAEELLGWKPDVGLEKGLQETISWIKDNVHLYRSSNYVV